MFEKKGIKARVRKGKKGERVLPSIYTMMRTKKKKKGMFRRDQEAG